MIGDDIAAALPDLRAEAESVMTLCVTPWIPAGKTKNARGFVKLSWDPQESHRGKFQGPSSASRDTPTRYIEIGEVKRPVLIGGLHIPLGCPIPSPSEVRGQGWEYVINDVGPVDDPALIGRRFLVVAVPAKSRATARRLDVVEVPAEPEV